MAEYTKKFFDYEKRVDSSGATAPAFVVFNDLPPETTVAVSPDAGATMVVQYRVTPNSALLTWAAGNVTAGTADSIIGAVSQVVITAVSGTGLAAIRRRV